MRTKKNTHLLRLFAIVSLIFCMFSMSSTLAYYTDHTDHVVNTYHYEESVFPEEDEPPVSDENPKPPTDGSDQVVNGTDQVDEPSSGPSIVLPSIGPSPETGTIGSLMIWNILSVMLTAFALIVIWKPGREKI